MRSRSGPRIASRKLASNLSIAAATWVPVTVRSGMGSAPPSARARRYATGHLWRGRTAVRPESTMTSRAKPGLN